MNEQNKSTPTPQQPSQRAVEVARQIVSECESRCWADNYTTHKSIEPVARQLDSFAAEARSAEREALVQLLAKIDSHCLFLQDAMDRANVGIEDTQVEMRLWRDQALRLQPPKEPGA